MKNLKKTIFLLCVTLIVLVCYQPPGRLAGRVQSLTENPLLTEWRRLPSIPHKIHFTWKDSKVIEKYPNASFLRNGVMNDIHLNPSWTWTMSDDKDIEQYLQLHLNASDYKLIRDRPIIEKTDLWRLLKIYYEGGYYQDFDMKYNQPLRLLITPLTRCMLPTYGNVNFRQDIMLCTAGSPIHKRAIELNLERRRILLKRNRKPSPGDILHLGPDTYKDAVMDVLHLPRRTLIQDARKRINTELYPILMAHFDNTSTRARLTNIPGAMPLHESHKDHGPRNKQELWKHANTTHWKEQFRF
jgi:hypothetical protein